jgi:membrane-bound serine protease (ClpP class)
MEYLHIAVILFTLGVISLLAEVLLPTGGILVVVSLLLLALGVGIILAQGTPTEAVVAVTALAVGLPAIGYVIVAAYRRMSVGEELAAAAEPLALPGASELEALKNRTGKTVTPMRPSGTVEFDGRRIDAMTEGIMLDAGVWVRCIAVRGNVVIVRQIEPPADVTDLDPDARAASGSQPRDGADRRPDTSPPPRRPGDDLDLDLDLGSDR